MSSISIISLYRQLFGKRDPVEGNVIDMAEHGRVGGVSTGQGFKFISPINPSNGEQPDSNYAMKIDASVAGTTYIGKAGIGSATSSALWSIKKIVESASVTTITWADGDDLFNNVWDDRASLSYS